MEQPNHLAAARYAEAMAGHCNVARAYQQLMNLLLAVTHHDGALKEQEAAWEPIVQAELRRRLDGDEVPLDAESVERLKQSKDITTIPEGRCFTVGLKCVDPDSTELLFASMFSNRHPLVAGCEVYRIDGRDVIQETTADNLELRRKILRSLVEHDIDLRNTLRGTGLLEGL